jgi:hypothetical protein
VARSLRQLAALLVVSCAFGLTLGAESSPAAAPNKEPAPAELWQQYPLEPLQGGQAPRRSILRIRQPAVPDSSSPDRLLLIGGLALFLLVLSDTVFLALSSRVVRSAR